MSTETAVMSTQDVANRLSELFKQNKWIQIQEELFSSDALSIEPEHAKGLHTVQGIENIKKKGEEFNAMIEEMHGGFVGEPIVGGRYIAVAMGMDVTVKGTGRMNMDEIALYEVKDGKIVKEQFFY